MASPSPDLKVPIILGECANCFDHDVQDNVRGVVLPGVDGGVHVGTRTTLSDINLD